MQVNVWSKNQFIQMLSIRGITDANVEDYKATCFISINDTSADDTYFSKNHRNVLTMRFDDVAHDLYDVEIVNGKVQNSNVIKAKALTIEQAAELYNFIQTQIADKRGQCIVHCTAGISRSGAVGSFINQLTEADDEKFKRDNPHILPNQHIMQLLNKVKNELN